MKKASISHPVVGQFAVGVPRVDVSNVVTFVPDNESGMDERYEKGVLSVII